MASSFFSGYFQEVGRERREKERESSLLAEVIKNKGTECPICGNGLDKRFLSEYIKVFCHSCGKSWKYKNNEYPPQNKSKKE